MSGYAFTYGVGRVHAGENDLLYVPRTPVQGRRPVILAHGWEATGKVFGVDTANAPKQCALAAALAAQGFLVAATDLGGTTSSDVWGNATHSARINELHSYLVTNFGCAADKAVMVGVSMGNLGAFSYQRDYAKVAGIVGIIPASDLDDMRNNNRLNTQASIDSAWGVGPPPAALPSGANPTTYSSHYVGLPYQAYYSSADTVCIASTVTALAAAIGGTATQVSSSLDHGDAVVGLVPVATIASFISGLGA